MRPPHFHEPVSCCIACHDTGGDAGFSLKVPHDPPLGRWPGGRADEGDHEGYRRWRSKRMQGEFPMREGGAT